MVCLQTCNASIAVHPYIDILFSCMFADVTLLTESYQALIYAYMNESPPNTQMAREILNTMLSSGVIQDITPAWTTLSRQLHLKGLAEDFVSVMQQGLEAGFKPSGEVAAPYLAALCDLGQKVGLCKGFALHVTSMISADSPIT